MVEQDREEPIFEPDLQSTTGNVGESIDDGRGRIFPCDRCGADLEFSIGQQSLQCPYCGAIKNLAPRDEEIVEHDFQAMLQQMQEWREKGAAAYKADDVHEVRCEGCGANVVFQGTLTSSTCPYCATPLQRDRVHDASTRIRVDAMLPFQVPRDRAAQALADWVKSRWFAPNDFKKMGARGKFEGCYLPYFTFDSATYTRWAGQRGDHYYVTVGSGKDRRQERRTRWSSRSGEFARFFDDVLVLAMKDEHRDLIQQLEPWPLGKCRPFTPEALAGFFARTYDIELDVSFQDARQRIDEALRRDVMQRIGGDEQRIHSQKTAYNAITFKHLLLPVWLLAYRYHDKTFQVVVNAVTGEVQGQRPYSWIKITLAVLFGIAVAAAVFMAGQS